MKKIVIIIATLICFFVGLAGIANAEQGENYAKLIVGTWEWRGVIDKQSVKVVYEYKANGMMNFAVYSSGVVYTPAMLQSPTILYRVNKELLITFLPTGEKWGSSKILYLDEAIMKVSEIQDFTGKEVSPNVIIYHRTMY